MSTTTSTITWPVVTHFLDADEIPADAVTKLGSSDIAYFTDAATKVDANGRIDSVKCPAGERFGLSLCLSSLATWIRNQYHLWHPQNPHTMLKHVPDIQNGVDVSPFHPDNYSGKVIVKFLEYLLANTPENKMIAELKKLGLTP